MGWESLMWSDLNLGPLPQGQTRIPRGKSAYSSLIIGRRGLLGQTKSWAGKF